MSLLLIKNLACVKGDRQLFHSLNFSLDAGEIGQITGANGIGKTSLLRIVCGLSQPDSGDLFWRNKAITDNYEEFCRELIFIGHKPGVNNHLTAYENLKYWCELQCLKLSQKRLDEALIKVGLYGREDIPAVSLSAGQQRRIALARLVLSDAVFWILDEPFTAIDAKGISVMQQWFAEHLQNGGMILLTSHQAIDSNLLSPKILALENE